MRRLTQKPYEKPFIANSPGTVVKEAKLVNKEVTEWKTTVETPGFPDDLPVLRVNVRLTAVFEDGSEEVVFRKKYKFEL